MVAFFPHFVSCSDFATLKDVIGNFIAYRNTCYIILLSSFLMPARTLTEEEGNLITLHLPNTGVLVYPPLCAYYVVRHHP